MLAYEKERLIEDVVKDLMNYKEGLFVTLNSLGKDDIKLNTQVETLLHWLNDHCYGNSYKKYGKRLRGVGVFEIGTVNQGLHIHLVLLHNNDINRTFQELEEFIRIKWYRLINAKSQSAKYGSLVNVQIVGNVNNRVRYMAKTYYSHSTRFNLPYF